MSAHTAIKTLLTWGQKKQPMLLGDGKKITWGPGIHVGYGSKTLGQYVKIASGGTDEYYFDDLDFVKNDKTIIRVTPEMTTLDFFDKLLRLGVIEQWRSSKKLDKTNDATGVLEN